MTHPDADTILKFVLQMLDEPDIAHVRNHLSECEECRKLQQQYLGEIKRLERIDFHVDVPAPPALSRRSRLIPEVPRWAAVLAAGFLLGFLTAQVAAPHHPIPVQQHLIPARGTVDTGFISCQAVDLGVRNPWK